MLDFCQIASRGQGVFWQVLFRILAVKTMNYIETLDEFCKFTVSHFQVFQGIPWKIFVLAFFLKIV